MKEKDIQRDILAYLRITGHYALRSPAGMIRNEEGRMIRMGDAGQPDILVGIKQNGIFELGFIECKTDIGRLSWKQCLVLREHHAKKRRWCVISSLDELQLFLANREYHGPDRFTHPILDLTYQYAEPKTRPFVSKPSPYDDLIKQGHERIERKRAELDISSLPF